MKLLMTVGTLIDVRVCARSLPPDASGDAVPISWDPWTIVNGEGEAGASLNTGGPVPKPTHLFPKEGSLRVGQCASGLVPFNVDEHSQAISVSYPDAHGDTAVWSAG